MAEERLEAKDWRVLLAWLLVGLVGAVVAWKYFFVAFPEAAVDFRISRPAALEQARKFLATLGYRADGYRSAIVFDVDENAKIFLEREVGLERANQLMASEVNVWYWQTRFFRSAQKEEFGVEVNPAGRVVGMKHTIEEDRKGASLEASAARALAEKFIQDHAGIDLASYDFLPEEANPTERPNRRDWSFTWERRGFKVKDAPYRLHVGVQGDEIGGFDQFLKVSEAWLRDFERLRSTNQLYESIALVPYALLGGAAVFLLIDWGRRGLVRWAGALQLALALSLLFFVRALNEWPLTLSRYDTNSTYAAFFASHLGGAILSSAIIGLSVALVVAAAEPLYRRDFPDKLRLTATFRIEGIRSKSFFRSCWIGLALAAAHIGFVVIFYVAGRHFGVWAPQDVKYDDTVSTALPWISPLAIALYAATSEEFTFRLFAIPFLLRLTKSRAAAVVLPAFIWGFLHSTYPVEPGYVRGIEVGLIGIVAGWVMLRWGILTTLVWHYTVDALLIGLFLLRSESLYFRLSGALVALFVAIPLGVAGIALIVRRRFISEEGLLNRDDSLPTTAAEPVEVRQEVVAYESCAPSRLRIALAAGLLGVVLVIAVKPQMVGDYVRVAINAKEATRAADQVMRARSVDPASYHHAATFVETYDPPAVEYLRRRLGVAGANRFYEQEAPSAFWSVRYFRDSQKEEYRVILGPDGSLHSVHHLLDDKAPGANLTKAAAQAKAEAYLRDAKNVDLTQWKLVESDSKKLTARTDHTFVWEKREGIGEAHVRREVHVQGDEVMGYRIFVWVPDQWRRELTQQTFARTAYNIVRFGLMAAWGLLILILFFRQLRQSAAKVPWRRLGLWAAWGAVGVALIFLNNYPSFLAAYETQLPLRIYTTLMVIALFLGVGLVFSALFFLLGLAWFFLSRAFAGSALPRWLGMPAAYYRDAFWLGLAGACVLAGLSRLPFLAARLWPTASAGTGTATPGPVDAWLPFMYATAGPAVASLFYIGLIGLTAGFLAAYARDTWLKIGFLVLVALALVGPWGSPSDYAKQVLLRLIVIGVVAWGVARIVRFNLLAYFVALMAAAVAAAALELLQQPNAFYRANGYAVVMIPLLLLAWPLLAWRAEPTRIQ